MFFDSGSNSTNNVTIYPQNQLHRSGYYITMFDTTILPYNKEYNNQFLFIDNFSNLFLTSSYLEPFGIY